MWYSAAMLKFKKKCFYSILLLPNNIQTTIMLLHIFKKSPERFATIDLID